MAQNRREMLDTAESFLMELIPSCAEIQERFLKDEKRFSRVFRKTDYHAYDQMWNDVINGAMNARRTLERVRRGTGLSDADRALIQQVTQSVQPLLDCAVARACVVDRIRDRARGHSYPLSQQEQDTLNADRLWALLLMEMAKCAALYQAATA